MVKKNKYAEREHFHPVIAIFIILVIGLIFWIGINHNQRISRLQEQLNNDGEWECIEREQVTYRQCEKLSNMFVEDLDFNSRSLDICVDNAWTWDCGVVTGFVYIPWDYQTEEEIIARQNKEAIENENCKNTEIYYGDCIKWQKVKFYEAEDEK